jgi:hypothetical protein
MSIDEANYDTIKSTLMPETKPKSTTALILKSKHQVTV